jgi:hypothetical protein
MSLVGLDATAFRRGEREKGGRGEMCDCPLLSLFPCCFYASQLGGAL